ncbi:MAG: hypothetical protein AAF682_19760 [Planctomycetota bacterium]
MTISRQGIEEGVQRFHRLIEADPALGQEFASSSEEFFGAGGPSEDGAAEAELAARRHLEWFALERYSDVLGGVPAEALQEHWLALGPGVDPHAFLNSLAGVFEVTSVEPGRGVWLRDLFGAGEYPIEEPEASAEVEVADVIVGRVFPAGDSVFRLSPAASLFRNGELLEALRRDLARLRQGRRGTLRIAQSEIERMFHAAGSSFGAPEDPATAQRRARTALVEAGVAEPLADQLVAEVVEASRTGEDGVVTEALNQLAFDTNADLEVARTGLLELWASLRNTPGDAAAPRAKTQARPKVDVDEGVSQGQIAEALARFDEGRRDGGNLEELFRTLEDDLGLEGGADEDDLNEAPDFPGVVGAMVEELLWEIGREEGDERARSLAPLRRLGEFAAEQAIGVFENLTAQHLLEFAGKWAIEREVVTSGDDARRLLDALETFCRWCEEGQDIALWTAFEALHGGLTRSVPRLVEIRRRLERQPEADGGGGASREALYTFSRSPSGEALLVDRGGKAREVDLHEDLAGLLRDDDLVIASIGRSGEARVSACYPPELATLVS